MDLDDDCYMPEEVDLDFGWDAIFDDGLDEVDMTIDDGPDYEDDLSDCSFNDAKSAKSINKNSSVKSDKTVNCEKELEKHLTQNKYASFKDVFNKNISLVAGIHINRETSAVEKLLNIVSSSEGGEYTLTEEIFNVKYVGFKPSKTDEEFSKIKDSKKLGNKAFLIYLFLTRGSNIDLIRNTSDKRTSEKLSRLQKMYNLKSKVSNGGPTALTLSRIAMTYPTIVASMLHKFDESKVKRPVTKAMLKKICGVDFPSVLMSNIVASLIPKDVRVITKDDSQKIRNVIALYTALEAQKTKRSFSEKHLQECMHLNAKYVTMAYNSDFVSEKERQSAFKKPYFKCVYHNNKLSNEVVKINTYTQKIIDKIIKYDPLFKI